MPQLIVAEIVDKLSSLYPARGEVVLKGMVKVVAFAEVPAGYGFIQEPNRGLVTWDYQVVSYQLASKHGTRDRFANMIHCGTTCLALARVREPPGPGSSFSHYNYPGIYQDQGFHGCRHRINDWSSKYEIQNRGLAGLADLATEIDYVGGRLAAYTNDLLSLGVDGFRLDAAKHMPVADISNILSRLNTDSKKLWFTQEVVSGGGVSPNEYIQTEVAFTRLFGIKASGNLLPSSHSNAYVLASVFTLAHSYGTPTVLLSYSFSNIDACAPNGSYGTCSGGSGANGWLCQHRLLEIAGMVGFHNAVAGAPMTNWVAPEAQRVAFGRGSSGCGDQQRGLCVDHDEYCDVVKGGLSNEQCTGASFAVSGGSFKASVSQRGAIAIHVHAKHLSGPAAAAPHLNRGDCNLDPVLMTTTRQVVYLTARPQ
ncbi:glycoside hydrolase superfamily [Earliella scabrosa]|nr:glycoside hydrolase superfamily [Earliella scabrosa]